MSVFFCPDCGNGLWIMDITDEGHKLICKECQAFLRIEIKHKGDGE